MDSMPLVGTSTGRHRRIAPAVTHPGRLEFLFAGVLIAAAILEGSLRPDLSWPTATTVLTILLIAGLPWRRRNPLALVVATTAATAAFGAAQLIAGVTPDGMATMFALILAPYSLFRWGARGSRIIGAVILAVGVVLSTILRPEPGTESIIGGIAGLLFVGSACLFGALRRERAERLEKEIAVVRSREREALARDLHDTIAHHVSAIAIRAQAAGLNASDPAVVSESLQVIEREATAVLTEMRTLVRALRAPGDYEPPAGLAALAGLADAGPPQVMVRIDAADPVSEVVAGTMHRIAQEAVTNARRHARGVTVISIALRSEEDDVLLDVVDDGRASVSGGQPGFGLRGMRERAALLGGSVDAGPHREGGWMLRARIPGSAG